MAGGLLGPALPKRLFLVFSQLTSFSEHDILGVTRKWLFDILGVTRKWLIKQTISHVFGRFNGVYYFTPVANKTNKQ